MKRPVPFLLFVAGLCLLAMTRPLWAAEESKPDVLPPALVTAEVLESKIAEAEAATGLEETAKTKLVEF